MISGPLYAAALETATSGSSGSVLVHEEDGGRSVLPVDRWAGPLGGADERVLADVQAPVLDVGCGPGRHAAGLIARGIAAVGVESAPEAARVARAAGVPVLADSIFRVPAPGSSWRTILLLDGNIGIGGEPVRLLRRMRSLLEEGGHVLVEVDPPGSATRRTRVRLEDGARTTDWHPWARVGVDASAACAAAAGLAVHRTWQDEERWFVDLVAAADA